MNPILQYFRGVRSELAKVSWPKTAEVVKLTLIVVIISTLVGTYVGLLDLGFARLLKAIIES